MSPILVITTPDRKVNVDLLSRLTGDSVVVRNTKPTGEAEFAVVDIDKMQLIKELTNWADYIISVGPVNSDAPIDLSVPAQGPEEHIADVWHTELGGEDDEQGAADAAS